jgi:hypothetical protein
MRPFGDAPAAVGRCPVLHGSMSLAVKTHWAEEVNVCLAVLQLSAPTELKGVLQALCCLPTPAPVCERAALARRPVCSSTHFLSSCCSVPSPPTTADEDHLANCEAHCCGGRERAGVAAFCVAAALGSWSSLHHVHFLPRPLVLLATRT